MLDVYELCTPGLQEKMVPYRSKFKDLEDKKINQQPNNVSLINLLSFFLIMYAFSLEVELKTAYNQTSFSVLMIMFSILFVVKRVTWNVKNYC